MRLSDGACSNTAELVDDCILLAFNSTPELSDELYAVVDGADDNPFLDTSDRVAEGVANNGGIDTNALKDFDGGSGMNIDEICVSHGK